MKQQEYLRKKLIKYFNLVELRTICFDLGYDYNTMRSETTITLSLDLLNLIYNDDNASNGRNNKLQSLIRLISNQRPNIFLERYAK